HAAGADPMDVGMLGQTVEEPAVALGRGVLVVSLLASHSGSLELGGRLLVVGAQDEVGERRGDRNRRRVSGGPRLGFAGRTAEYDRPIESGGVRPGEVGVEAVADHQRPSGAETVESGPK